MQNAKKNWARLRAKRSRRFMGGGGQLLDAFGNCADADGIVPEYYGDYGEDWVGYTDTISISPCQRATRYDTKNMKGAGPKDWARVRAHERAHAAGWDHWAGRPSTNAAYFPRGRITGT